MNTIQQSPKDYYLGFNYHLDRQSVANLVSLAHTAVSCNAKSITICISSNGGAPDQAYYAYEVLSALPVPVHTHATGSVHSAAITLFLAGTRRTASPGSNFLFHDTIFAPQVAPSMRLEDLIGQAQGLEHTDKWSHQLIAKILKRPAEEVAEWYRGQHLRDTEFALKRGIIERVQKLAFDPAAEYAHVAYKF